MKAYQVLPIEKHVGTQDIKHTLGSFNKTSTIDGKIRSTEIKMLITQS